MKLNGFYGAGSGRLGEAVASNGSNGATIWRKYQPKVNQPNTDDQREVRTKFKVIASVGTAFKPILRIGMHHGKKYRVSYVNNFIRKNWDKVTSDNPETAQIALDEIMLSNPAAGVVGANYSQPDFSERDSVSITVTVDETQIRSMYTDIDSVKVYAAVYQADLNQCVIGQAAAQAGEVSVVIPRAWSGMRGYVYGILVAHSASLGNLPSETTCIGSGNLS